MIPFIIRYHRALIGVGLVVALFVAFRLYVAGQVEQARLEDAAAVQRMDAIADDVAGQVAATQAAAVETKNSEARTAAAKSDDPLADGLRALNKK